MAERLGVMGSIQVPKIFAGPSDAIKQLEFIIKDRKLYNPLLIVSSLKGYYATYLLGVLNAPVVLINPVVDPFQY